MVGATSQVGLIEVIRFDACQEELVDEAYHHSRIVIHAFEQNGLGAQGNAGIG